jgi:ribosome recycling factor
MSTDPDEILLAADDKMDSAVEAKRELNGIRTGRAHPSLVETLHVDYGQ